jgi:hypothetical protein
MDRGEDYIERPEFEKISYDHRNLEKVGHYRGVGESGKIGNMGSSLDIYPMPKEPSIISVPRYNSC